MQPLEKSEYKINKEFVVCGVELDHFFLSRILNNINFFIKLQIFSMFFLLISQLL